MAGDGYVFDFQVEVVQRFCFQILACGTGAACRVQGAGKRRGLGGAGWIGIVSPFWTQKSLPGWQAFFLYPII
jgi:hypothetical protein